VSTDSAMIGCANMASVTAPSAGGRRAVRACLRALPAVLLLASTLSACGGDSPPQEEPRKQNAALEVELASGVAGLDSDSRSRVQNAVGDVLSEYVVDGFLGDYPREDFVQSFDRFTSGAARGAARDIDLLTAARFSDSDGVRARRLLARISCLTVDGEVVGATAHVSFTFEATDGPAAPTPISLRGRFLMDQEDGKWSVFGYDLVRDDAERVGS